jgi:hypothetical protein
MIGHFLKTLKLCRDDNGDAACEEGLRVCRYM